MLVRMGAGSVSVLPVSCGLYCCPPKGWPCLHVTGGELEAHRVAELGQKPRVTVCVSLSKRLNLLGSQLLPG